MSEPSRGVPAPVLGLFAVIFVCMILALWYLVSSAESLSSSASSGPGPTPREEVLAPPSESKDEAPPSRRVSISPPSLLVSVMSRDNKPVKSAAVFVTRIGTLESTGRSYDESKLRPLGTTEASGDLACEKRILLGRTLVVSRRGYSIAYRDVPATLEKESITVRLDPAGRLAVRCSTRAGDPVPNVEVAVSRSPLPRGRRPDARFRSRRPARNEAVAVYRARTGADGVAFFHDLPTGRVFVQVFHRSYVNVGGFPPRQRGRFQVERKEGILDLLFDPVYCALAIITDDTLLTWGARYPKGFTTRPNLCDYFDSWKAHWRATINGPVICIYGTPIFSGGRYAEVPDNVNVDVFTLKHGHARVQVAIREATEASLPTKIVIGEAGESQRVAKVRVVLATSSGTELDLERIYLTGLRGNPNRMSIPVSTNTPVALPVGKYAVESYQPFLRDLLKGKTIEVGGEETAVVRLGVELTVCRLRMHYESGLPVRSGECWLAPLGGKKKQLVTTNLSAALALPVGGLNINATGMSGASVTSDVTVPRSSEVVLLDVGVLR